MNAWWQGLNPRERLLVTLACAASLLALIYLWGVEPLQVRHTRLEGELEGQTRALEVLRALGEEADALRAQGTGRRGLAEGQSLLALLNASAKARGISPAIERIVPNGANEASVVVQGIAFDTLVAWLMELRESNGVEARRLVVDGSGTAVGMVNASLTLVAGGGP